MKVKSKKVDLAEGDLTPMIDMVFQLIAFFMVLINFAQTESNDRVKLPSSHLCEYIFLRLGKNEEKPWRNLSN